MKEIFCITITILFIGCKKANNENGSIDFVFIPPPPTALTAKAVSSTQVNLFWTDNSNNETGFRIERRTGAEDYTFVRNVDKDVTSYNDNGLVAVTSYIYRVKAYNVFGMSNSYSNEASVTTNDSESGDTVADRDGNVYPTVKICDQEWMAKNLNVSTYRNGDPIPQVQDPMQWANLTTGAWCYYENNIGNEAVYGKLYNWYAINDSRGLAPVDWHIPNNAEWTTLINCLGGESVAGGKMKSTGIGLWTPPNVGATNSSGFSGLPGGKRIKNGTFYDIGNYASFWTFSEGIYGLALGYYLDFTNAYIYNGNYGKEFGFYVRCVKD